MAISCEGKMKYLIIGNGIAGITAAETIRGLDSDCRIIMVSRERTLPYSRPLISYVVSGELDPEEIIIRSDDFYENLGIETFLGRVVKAINITNKTVLLDTGESIEWDRMLIATGANPKLMEVEGKDLKNIYVLRNIDDAVKIVSSCRSGVKKAAVLGGGLVGFKAAYGLFKRGVDVSILITSNYPLSQVADEKSGKLIKATLENHGLKVEVGKSVRAFEGKNGKVCGALLDDYSTIEVDLVIVGKGVNPAISFVEGTGIVTRRGIIVNDTLETSVSNIFAAGDVAEAPDVVW